MADDIDDPNIARPGWVPQHIAPDDIDDPKLARQAHVPPSFGPSTTSSPNRPKYETTVRGKRPSPAALDVRATMPQQRGVSVRGTGGSRPTPSDRGLAIAVPPRGLASRAEAEVQSVDPAATVDWSGLRRRLERWVPDGVNDVLRALSDVGNRRTADAFVGYALGQKGHPYDQATAAPPTDLSPRAFDCSSLVRWAAARQGVGLPRTSTQQLAAMRSAGVIIPVEEAIRIRGALLFHSGHVAISLGNGRTIEAIGRKWGVREGGTVVHNKDGTQRPRFTEGALIPELRY